MALALDKKRKPQGKADSPAHESQAFGGSSGAPAGLPLFLQAKALSGNSVGSLEAEAERVEALIASGEPANSEHHECSCAASGAPCPKCQAREQMAQRKAEAGSKADVRAPSATLVPQRLGSGRPLPASTRTEMESRFGVDFSVVRIHSGPEAGRYARSLSSLAFTSGRDIVFAENNYRPDTVAGKALLGHELTHVLQQGSMTGIDVQYRVEGDVRQISINPAWTQALDDQELPEQIRILQTSLATLDRNSADYQAQQANLTVLEAEVSNREARRLFAATSTATAPRPPGLPLDGGFMLQAIDGLPDKVAARIPEGQITTLPSPQSAQRQGVGAPQVTAPIAGALGAGNIAANAQLMQTGFQTGLDNAIGIVAIPRWTPANVLQGRVPPVPESIHIPGHTAIYSRVNGQITVVRGFGPESNLATIRNYPSLMEGSTTTPASIASDADLFTNISARSLEYAVTPQAAEAFGRGLPLPGAPPAGMPPGYTFRPDVFGNPQAGSNCVLWGCTQVEGALGGPVAQTGSTTSVTAIGEAGTMVPNTASQGRLISLMSEGDIAPVPNATAAVVGEMSTGLKVLKVGGRVFLVIGVAATIYDIASATPEERGRTAARDITGFAAGFAAGAAAGLLCGPGALVCSIVLGLAFGIAGTYAGSALGEGIYDALTAPSGTPDNRPIPNIPPGTVCPNCHAPVKPQSTLDNVPWMLPQERTLSAEDRQALLRWITAGGTQSAQ